MTHMTSLTEIFFVSIVTNIALAFSLNSNRQTQIAYIGLLTAWSRFWTFHMVRWTLAHTQMNYHVLQFGHWNQGQANK